MYLGLPGHDEAGESKSSECYANHNPNQNHSSQSESGPHHLQDNRQQILDV